MNLSITRAILRHLLILCCAAAGWGAELSGNIRIIQGPEDGKSTTIVYAVSLDEHAPPPKPGHYELKQQDKAFIPHVLAVPVGSTVSFPNEDAIFHNVFSLSRPAPFDLGLYRAGASKSRVFDQPAIYRIFCNIHPQMSAVLLVLPTSWITSANGEGMYRMDLPRGHYRVTAWSERSQPASTEVTMESAPVTASEMTLDESKFVEIRHNNKFGQQYPPSAYRTPNR